ncbi:hypothetical protein ROZALSC1DRAFT_22947, partial [Rozella allomycis CSF55]
MLVFTNFVFVVSGFVLGIAFASATICIAVAVFNRSKIALFHALCSIFFTCSYISVNYFQTNTGVPCFQRAPVVGFFHVAQVLAFQTALWFRVKAAFVVPNYKDSLFKRQSVGLFLCFLQIVIVTQATVLSVLYATSGIAASALCGNTYNL